MQKHTQKINENSQPADCKKTMKWNFWKANQSSLYMLNLKSLVSGINLSKREKWLLTILFPIPGWTIFVAIFALYKVIKHKIRGWICVNKQFGISLNWVIFQKPWATTPLRWEVSTLCSRHIWAKHLQLAMSGSPKVPVWQRNFHWWFLNPRPMSQGQYKDHPYHSEQQRG